jgi:hypothetical protein
MLVYKFIETTTVTDESLEKIVNEWIRKGWIFDRIQFVVRESSKRPTMAFVIFYKDKSPSQ